MARILKRFKTINEFNWGTDIDWNAIGQQTGNIIGGWIGTNDQPSNNNSNNTPNLPNGNVNPNYVPPKDDNTALYIVGGLGLAAVLFMASSGSSNKKK